jgi:hypothetical protein
MTVPLRQVLEGIQKQGIDESIVYTVTTTPWGNNPSNPEVTIWKKSGTSWVDVSITNLLGDPTVLGNVITLPAVHSLTIGTSYKVIVEFTLNDSVVSAYIDIIAEK